MSDKKGDRPSTAFNEKYWDAVWTATANPMAIGNVDTDANGNGGDHTGHGILTRQITGVAAGTDLTDAVNVAQLQAAIAQFSGSGSGTSGDGVHYYSVLSNEIGPDSNYDNKGAKGKNSLAAGVRASTTENAENAVAIGYGAKAEGKGATVIGQYAKANGDYAMAFGIKSKAEGKNSLAGLGGQAVNENSIALGKDTKANNAQQAVSVAIGENAEASGARSLAIGFGVKGKVTEGGVEKDDTTLTQTTASGESAISIGTDTQAAGQHSLAMGSHTSAAKDSSIAIGYDTHAVNDSTVAIGSGTQARGRYSVAMGLSSVAGKETNDVNNPLDGGGSVAIGYAAAAEATRSVAIGTGSTAAEAAFTTALGDSASAKQRGSVAVGAGSVATRAAGNKENGTDYKAAYRLPDLTNATDAEIATWTSTEGAVSVGGTATYKDYDANGKQVTKTKLLTRQITNVAAGSEDTDAVNVAQLKQAGFISYKANGGTAHTVTLKDGLDFTNGTNTTAEVGANGVVKFNVADSTFKDKAREAVIVKQGDNVTVKTDADEENHKTTYTVSAKDTHVTSGTATYADNGTGTITLTNNDNSTVTVSGLKNIYTTGVTADAANHKATFNRNDGSSYELKLSDLGGSSTDYQLVGSDGNVGNGEANKYSVANNKVSLNVKDTMSGTTKTVVIDNIASKTDLDNQTISYTANSAAPKKSVKLSEGLNFTDGTNTTAEVGVNGVVKFNVADSTFKDKAREAVVVNAGDNVTVTPAEDETNHKTTYTVSADNMRVKSGTATYNTDGTGTIILTNNDGTTATVSGLKDTYTKSAAYDAANKKATFTRNDNSTYDLDLSAIASEAGNVKLNFQGENTDTTISRGNSDTLSIVGDGTNISTNGDATKSQIKVALNDNLVLGKDGTNGKDGSIGIAGKDGADGYTTTIIKTEKGQPGKDGKNGQPGVNGTDITRIVYGQGQDGKDGKQVVATLDDGQKYAGDNYVAATDQAAEQNVIAKKLNERLDIKGGANKDNLTDKNIGVNAVGGALKVQLAKNIDLTDGGSVTTGNTVINNMGLTVGGKTYVSSTGLNANSQVIANVANGSNDNDAVNVSQLKDSRTTVTSSNQSIKVQDTTNGNPNHAYDIMVDYGTVAKNTSISYKANGGTAQTVTLKEGLDFTNGTNTTAEVGANGVVKFNVADSTFKDKARQAVAVEAGDNVTVTPTKDDANHKTTYTVSAADMRVNSGTATYNTDGTGTITLTNNDGTTATVSGLKDTYTKSAAYDAASKKATFTRNDNTTYDLDLSDIANEAGRVKLNFKGDNADTTISRGNSDTLSIVGDGTNISTTGDATKNEIKVALNDNLVLGKDGKDGKDGSIGLVGKNGKDGSVTTIIKTIGKNGADGKNGTPGVNGQDGITRIVYQDGKDGEAGTTTHTVATLDDGLKFGANAAVENGTNPVGNKLNSTIDIVGTKAKDGHTYSADNLTTTVAQDASGKTTITVLMDNAISADSVKVGKDGKDGTNGVDGRLIIKNGKDGKDGADAGIHVIKGEPGVNGKDGETITRVVYNDGKDGKDGKDYTLATTEDGLKFKGDDDTIIAKKLNEQLDIIGGATGALTDKNIAVKSTTDGKLKVQLAKDLTDLNSVTTGDTVMNSDGLTINKAGKAGDKTITISKTTVSYGDIQVNNMGSGADGKDENGKPTYNTDTNGANIGDVKNIAGKTSTDLTAKGLDFVGNDNVKVHRDLGTTLTIQGEGTKDDTNYSGENLKVIGDANGSLTIKMDKDITGNSVTVGKDGKDGTNGVDGRLIIKNGKDGKDGADAGIHVIKGEPGVNGKDGETITRVVYNDGKDGKDGKDYTLATTEDGLKFKGDDDTIIAKKLNEQLDIIGGATGALTDKNIAVKSTTDGKLKVQLAKDLTDLNSVTTGDTVMNSDGLTINKAGKAGDKTITISKTTVSYGDIQVNNMGSGADGKDENGKPTYNTDTNGANIGDVKNIAGKTSTDLTAKGLDFVGNDNVKVHRDLGTTLTIQGEGTKDDTNYSGENLKVIGDANGSLTIKMDKDIKGNSVTVGERGADGKDGVDGTIGVNGKDGSAVVINGKDGSIGLNGKDGANGLTIKGDKGAVGVDGTDGKNGKDGMTRIVYQDGKDTDHTVATLDDGMKYAGNFGQGAAVKLNKTVTIKGNLAANAKEDDFVDGNIAVTANKSDDNGELLIKLNKNLTGLNSSTYTSNMTSGGTSTTVVDGSGLKITNGPSITYTGIDAGSHVISHVADGKAPTDAVNVSQLTKVEQEATAHSSVEAGPSGNVTVTPGTNKNGGTKYTVDLADNVNFGKGDKKISINGDNGTVTIGQGDKQIKLDSKDGSISAGGVTINKDGKGTVNGLTNTTWDGEHITSGQAATEDQLQKVEQNVNTKIDNVNNKVDKVAKQHTTVSVNGGNAQGNLVMEKTNATDEKGANYDISLSNDVTIGTQGENGKDGKLTVTSKDGTKAITADGQNGTLTFKDGNNETSIKAAEASKGVDGKTDIKRVAIDGHTVATTDDGMKFAGDSGDVIQQKLNSTTNIKGGATGALTDGNIGVVSDGNNTLTVKLAKDIKGLDSVTATTVNATTVNSSSFNIAGDDSHDAITIKQGDVNMGGNTISGVAPGKVSQDSTDAINGSQLWQRDQAINSIGGAVNKLGSRVNRVGAGAAALAALHPLDFDPDDKWDFAAGYGNYRGANAAAVGAYYRPNEDTMFSVGGSFGGGENMVNAGVSFKLGQGNHVSTSRVAMAKEIKDLRQNVANLNAIVNRQSALIDKLTGTNAGMIKDKGNDLFPDVPANHWAYEYVTKLKHAGILTGYPDGNFDGDRMMTRYEFAAIVYRAIMAGAASNPALNQDGTLDKLANEFSSEMKYIRIDTIAKDKNGKPTIERVRVISDAK
ncbi:YadA-like family protein [Megasphaera elsdenii]|uniref:YadA-like family protein n=1 Tax=Megasphaera elsdenii TaxID=907 RepID=UPI00265FD9A0|nr:YadA-like family protein [Megasphaera elsdenii]